MQAQETYYRICWNHPYKTYKYKNTNKNYKMCLIWFQVSTRHYYDVSIEDFPCPQVLGGGAYVKPNVVWEIAQVMMMMKVKHYLY